jgi:hypothetical protein
MQRNGRPGSRQKSACAAHGLTLVTANVREFQRVPGLSIEELREQRGVQ